MESQEITQQFKTHDPAEIKDAELAMVGAIIGDHYADQIYDQELGYISTLYTIATITRMFVDQYLDYDWENLLDNTLPSPFPKSIDCWDDAVVWFAGNELQKLGINVQLINQ